MMRPGVITDEISPDFEHALDVMLEYDVREAELRGLWRTNILDLSEEQLQRAREALETRGIRVCSIASPLYKTHLFPEHADADAPRHRGAAGAPDEQLQRLERAIEIARYFNTGLIRIFTFWRRGEMTDEVFEAIVEALRPAARRAEEAGVVLGVENEHACFVGTGAETARLMQAVDSPALRAVWDPGNAFFAEERPFPDGYEAVRPWIVHLHVKDAAVGPDGKPGWTVVGEGQIDFQGQLAALAADGFDGVLSLETHFKQPGGTAEEASRACLVGMQRLLTEVGALAPA